MNRETRRLIQKTMDTQRELTQSGLSRRNLLKLGVLSAGTGMLLPIKGLSLRPAMAAGLPTCPVPGVDIISPYTTPFKMPFMRLALTLSRIRSAVTSRSNWAKDRRMLRVRRPIEVVVLKLCVTDTKVTLLRSKTSTSFEKSISERLR